MLTWGGGVIKQRIARAGQGRSGGCRTIIIYLRGQRAFFVYGFAKADRDNIGSEEVTQFKAMARHVLALSDQELSKALDRGIFVEVGYGEKLQE